MLGAIIGDIAGSRYEFNPTNDYHFEMFSKEAGYTDDTICTCAIADADTLGAIVGSIAEAIWGIPEDMKAAALSYMDDRMKNMLFRWERSMVAEDNHALTNPT